MLRSSVLYLGCSALLCSVLFYEYLNDRSERLMGGVGILVSLDASVTYLG